jgi:hypothetical protein
MAGISSSQHLIQSTVQLLKRYRHVNWALADQAMLSGVNFLTVVLLARALGIEEFGRFYALSTDGVLHHPPQPAGDG